MATRFAFSKLRGIVLMLGIGLAIVAPAVAETVERAPADVVTAFLKKVETSPADANAMLTEDAQMGVGDVGGEMDDVSILTMMFEELGGKCLITDIKLADRQFEDMPDISIVSSKIICATDYKFIAEREMDISFFVRGDAIAGMYIHADGPPIDEYDASAEVEE